MQERRSTHSKEQPLDGARNEPDVGRAIDDPSPVGPRDEPRDDPFRPAVDGPALPVRQPDDHSDPGLVRD